MELLGGSGIVFCSGESGGITVNLDVHAFVFLFQAIAYGALSF